MQGTEITFLESKIDGYRSRTIENASADATIAFAINFNTPGEKLTRKSVLAQGKKYIPIAVNASLEFTSEIIEVVVEELNGVGAKTLNVAGNGIYTLQGKFTQYQIDDFTYNFLKLVLTNPHLINPINKIQTGGQTGFDEAGAKAGIRLGIPTTIIAPKGYSFRNSFGIDIFNEQLFKKRFLLQLGESTSGDTICGFRGHYSFLSNFYIHNVIYYEGLGAKNVEALYQGMKSMDYAERVRVATLGYSDPFAAKKLGKKIIHLRKNWDKIKLKIMKDLLKIKFEDNFLRIRLSNTGNALLVEDNSWNDTFWGVCNGAGENHLGKLLMEVRKEILID